jgi:hypothetical protein
MKIIRLLSTLFLNYFETPASRGPCPVLNALANSRSNSLQYNGKNLTSSDISLALDSLVSFPIKTILVYLIPHSLGENFDLNDLYQFDHQASFGRNDTHPWISSTSQFNTIKYFMQKDTITFYKFIEWKKYLVKNSQGLSCKEKWACKIETCLLYNLLRQKDNTLLIADLVDLLLFDKLEKFNKVSTIELFSCMINFS